MKTRRSLVRATVAACAVGGLSFPLAQAQETFPSRPIHIVVPYPAGGVGDQLVRAIQKPMQEILKQTVVVENRIGAGGTIGTTHVARAAPDGYTLVLGNSGPISVGPQVRKTPYDPAKDLIPVSLIANAPLILAVSADNPAKTVPEFIQQAKVNSWNYGSTGPASLSHLTGEYFNSAAGLKLTHVPYNGGAQMVTAFGGGDLQAAFVTGPDSAAMLQSGKIRYLAVAAPRKVAIAPELPVIAETLPGFVSAVWYGILAPTGVPEPILKTLNSAIAQAVAHPDTQKAFAGRYIELLSGSREDLGALIREETQRWGAEIKRMGLKLD